MSSIGRLESSSMSSRNSPRLWRMPSWMVRVRPRGVALCSARICGYRLDNSSATSIVASVGTIKVGSLQMPKDQASRGSLLSPTARANPDAPEVLSLVAALAK